MSSVFYCSKTNSTTFTTCCGVAICDDESRCPSCREEVPYTPHERHNIAMNKLFGGKAMQQMRSKWRQEMRKQVVRKGGKG